MIARIEQQRHSASLSVAASETNQAWWRRCTMIRTYRERERDARDRTDYGNGGSVPDRSRALTCRTRRLGSTGLGFLLHARSTLTDTQRAGAATSVCRKCAHVVAELSTVSHSSSSRRFDRPAAPALLPAGLVDVVGAQQAASCYESTEHLQSEHTCGSGAGAHRGAVTACLEERRSHARSWRKPSIQVSIPPVASIPQLSEHICCENSAVRRSFDTGSST